MLPPNVSSTLIDHRSTCSRSSSETAYADARDAALGQLAHQRHQGLVEYVVRLRGPCGLHVIDEMSTGKHESQQALVVVHVRILLAQGGHRRRKRLRLQCNVRRAVLDD